MSFDAIEEVMVTTALCCILVAIDEKGEVAVGLGGGHMLDQHWRESSEDCDEASNMNLNEDSGLVGIEEYRVDYPMNVGDAS
jgi:outer membrane protease